MRFLQETPIRLNHSNNSTITATIPLAGSKSISNRALIIKALSGFDCSIDRLASAKDTDTLQDLLKLPLTNETVYDAGPAGTTYRFMTAYLAMQQGSQILTGSERMKERPIGILVEALNTLGADIEYLEKEGYPPLKINAPKNIGATNKIQIPANVSSQYISALLMIAPVLDQGLELELTGKIVSRPYIQMTLNLMQYYGVSHDWEGQVIKIKKQDYKNKAFVVEADWSAASYYYAVAAIAESADLQLDGLFEDSVQGDSVIVEIAKKLGVQSTFNETGVRIQKTGALKRNSIEYDFLECPDIAQTVAVICAGTGIMGLFSGLETLRIKETDRIEAVKAEFKKVGVEFYTIPNRMAKNDSKAFFMTEGKYDSPVQPRFDTYEDHRMAMAFAPLALLGTIEINEPEVVKKSYPEFWEHFELLGFEIESL